jgi:hypothetical protein
MKEWFQNGNSYKADKTQLHFIGRLVCILSTSLLLFDDTMLAYLNTQVNSEFLFGKSAALW